MSSPCPRLFEVEALRDGRLVGVERTRFERHLETCAACRKEATALDSLGQALRTATDLPRDELRERRERTRLLESFDRSLLNGAPRNATHKRWTWLYAAATLVACLAVVFAIDLGQRPPNTAAIQAVQGTSWSRELTAEQELVRLVQGELRIHVDETEGKRTLLVELPDGELEDIGTTFSVLVESGRTTRVVVEEGLVLLRLRGSLPVTITAGTTWTPTPNVEPSVQPRVLDARPPGPVARPSESAAPPPGERLPGAPHDAPPPDSRTATPTSSRGAPGAPAPRDAASEAFRDAVSTLDAGEPRRAAQEFSRFIARYPGDRRVEDAAYLRVLALHRSGDAAATRDAAQQYLRRHPSGFRRAEVEKLAR